MIKRSFLGFSKSHLSYETISGPPRDPEQVPVPEQAVYIVKAAASLAGQAGLAPGLKVKTGQKLALGGEGGAYALSTVTGKVATVEGYSGDFGNDWTRIVIDVAGDEQADDLFKASADDIDLATAVAFLGPVPGAPSLSALADSEKPIHTIIVNGVDKDLLSVTAQHTATSDIEAVTAGIGVLKKISGVEHIILTVQRDVIPGYGHIGAEAKAVDPIYPAGFPVNIMRDVLGLAVPNGKNPEDLGVCFISVEGVASIGRAVDSDKIPCDKILTLVDRDGTRHLVSARVGTPIAEVFKFFGITVKEKDQIILGGPMTGQAIFSETHPVQPDTDMIIVQDGADIPMASGYPCTNCGDCIRTCPVNVPVNMLVRFLEVGQYEEAADGYDLYSCIECGLCSYVCIAKIPIFQYIKLAKFELDRINTAEAANE